MFGVALFSGLYKHILIQFHILVQTHYSISSDASVSTTWWTTNMGEDTSHFGSLAEWISRLNSILEL
jgi:hypothetical protein